MELSNLPKELLVLVAEFVDDEFSINALLQTCKRFPPLLNPCLYELNVRYSHSCALEWGAKNGYKATVRRSLQAGASPSSAHYESWVPMALACIHGHEAVVRVLLEYGVDPVSDTMHVWLKEPEYEPQTDDEGTPLILAAAQGHEKVVRLLISAGVPHDIRCEGVNGFDISPLSMAARNGHLSLVKSFIALGSDIQIEALYDSIIADAANEGHIEVVRFLLETEPQMRSPNISGQALFVASSEGHLDVVELLLEYGVVPTPTVPAGSFYPLGSLITATQREYYEVVERLLECMNIEDFITHGEPDDENHRQLLLVSAAYGLRDTVERLLERGCSSDFLHPKSLLWSITETLPDGKRRLKDGFDTSPLTLAAHHGHDDIVDMLLKHNGQPEVLKSLLNDRDPNPLFLAIDGSHLEITRTLLNHGANPNQIMGNREPVFFKAVHAPKIFQLLLDHGADLELMAHNLSGSTGESIYKRALHTGNLVTLDVLQQKCSFKELQQTKGCNSISLLNWAARGGVSVIEYLLNSGYKVIPGSREVETALKVVLSQSDTTSLAIFFDKGLVPTNLFTSMTWKLDYNHSPLGLVNSPGVDKDRDAMSATLDMLIAHGFQINGQPTGGYPLLEALSGENIVLCQLLLDRGADPLQSCGRVSQKPLGEAARYGNKKLVRAMLQSLDQRSISLEELRDELYRAEQMAERGLEMQAPIIEDDVRPLLRRFYWRKRYSWHNK